MTDARWQRLDGVQEGARILIPGYNGEDGAAAGTVTKVNGPHGPLGTPPTSDWYTLRVRFDASAGYIGHGVHDSVVGPRRGADQVLLLAARAPEQLLDEAWSALEDVDGFLETVTQWNGTDPDELHEAQEDVRKMLTRLAAASPNPIDGEG